MIGKIVKGRNKGLFFRYCRKCKKSFKPTSRRSRMCTDCVKISHIEGGLKRKRLF